MKNTLSVLDTHLSQVLAQPLMLSNRLYFCYISTFLVTVTVLLILYNASMQSLIILFCRYWKRKSEGKLKSSSDLDAKALKRQQKKCRQNSAKYYRKQKTLRDVLDLTPPSITDETDVEPGPSRKVLRPMTENGENQSALEAPSTVVTLRTSTPKPNRSAA